MRKNICQMQRVDEEEAAAKNAQKEVEFYWITQ